MFGDIGIDKDKLHYPKNPVRINEVDICKTLISSKISFAKKYYLPKYIIGYKDDDYKCKSLCKTLTEMNGYEKGYEMSFFY